MSSIENFQRKVKGYSKTPEFIAFGVLVGLIVTVFVISLFYLPSLFIIVSAIAFSGMVVVTLLSGIRLMHVTEETDRKSLELAHVIDNLEDAIVGYTPDFEIVVFNSAAEKLFKVPREKIIGQVIGPKDIGDSEKKFIAQIVFPSLAPSAYQISEPGTWPQAVDISFENPDLEFHTVLYPITNEKGVIVRFIKTVINRSREQSVLKSKNEFINVTAHQLRTPLTALNWTFESMLKMIQNNKELSLLAEEGKKVAERGLKIVNDLLNISTIEEGRFGFRFEEVDINDFVKKIVLAAKPLADHYRISLSLTPLLKRRTVQIDQEKLGMACANLIENAIKYNIKNGRVDVEMKELSDSAKIEIAVKDTGIGILPEEVPKLFQKFYRGSRAAEFEPNGTGLGLYIVKNIIEKHGGVIAVTSTPGRGTIFTCTLPLKSQVT